MKTIFSGVQPSGNLHIGNYLGALKQWVELQKENEAIFCIVDLHAITVPQDPKTLHQKVLDVVALYLACGIDPAKAHIFVQSENPDHPYLTWIFNCITPFGNLERMTQFKEKSQKHEANVGLFDYPVLMAVDILLYKPDEVPVGEDQRQHLELTRDIAEKFNKTYGEVFKLPNAYIPKSSARIMSLQNPSSKMSKSDNDPLGTINILDSEEQIREKIKKAVTDSGSAISKDAGGEGISNLLAIYAAFKNQSLDSSYNELEGKLYGEFKSILSNLVVSELSKIQEKYNEIRNNEANLRKILDEGVKYATSISSETILAVKQKVGLQ